MYALDGYAFMATELRETSEFIGLIGIQRMNFLLPGLSVPAVEIGWRLNEKSWGKGLATEGARACLSLAFEKFHLPEVVAFTIPANLPSRRVMEKLGMIRNPDEDFDDPRIPAGHPFQRHVLYRIQKLACGEQYLAMAFAQLTYRESLRDIEACLGAIGPKLYHMGIGSAVARSTLADANENRDWRIFSDFAQVLIRTAITLYANDATGIADVRDLYALDSTTIDLCLSVFPWARFRKHKGAVKMHTLLDLHGPIPTFIHITNGKVHEVNILDEILPEAGSFHGMDRGYVDFKRLYRFTLSSPFLVVRTKKNVLLQRRYSHPVDKSTGVRSDQTVVLATIGSASAYPDTLRRVSYFDAVTGKRLVFPTNNFTLPALTIAQIYKQRWQVELFFRWVKMHLRIKAFYGTSANAVKTQIWIAVSVYVPVAIVRKQLGIEGSLYQILQILSLTLFEKTSILQVLQTSEYDNDLGDICSQLILFDL